MNDENERANYEHEQDAGCVECGGDVGEEPHDPHCLTGRLTSIEEACAAMRDLIAKGSPAPYEEISALLIRRMRAAMIELSPQQNRWSVTWPEWAYAAGYEPRDTQHRASWLRGEDPTEHRAQPRSFRAVEDLMRARARAEGVK